MLLLDAVTSAPFRYLCSVDQISNDVSRRMI
jgi:hypothetical protein